MEKVKQRLYDYYEKMMAFLDRYVLKYPKKAISKLVHNSVIYVEHSYILWFNKYKMRISNKTRESSIGYMFILIWIIGYLIFALYPVFNSLYLSFFKVRLAGSGIDLDFVGIGNYRAAFLQDPYFVEILINYALRLLLNVPVTIVFALIIAMLINQDVKGKGAWRTIFFLPVIITSGPVIAELMAQGATTLPTIEDYQFIDTIIDNIGAFLANPVQALFNEILLVLWFAGIQILILLAGLQKIDKGIYEAAMIDGASPWEGFWKITLPSIMPLITVSIIYTVVSMSVFSLNEVIVYIRNVMLGESTPALTTGYGYSATLSWIYFLAMALIILIFIGLITIRRKKVR
ncbi:MAG: carbohydrate ABC transporter permease [Candidatus Izemoplasmataceae bacterium]